MQIAATNWSSSVASSNLVRAVLQERLGYRCRISTTGIEEVWRSVAGGAQDLTTSAWLPDPHAPYFERFADRVDVLDPFHELGRHPGNLARPRRFEIAAAINRLRSVRMRQRREAERSALLRAQPLRGSCPRRLPG